MCYKYQDRYLWLQDRGKKLDVATGLDFKLTTIARPKYEKIQDELHMKKWNNKSELG